MDEEKQAEREHILARDQRITRIGNLAAAMLHFDSPMEFVDAAIEMAFRIDKAVTKRVNNGD